MIVTDLAIIKVIENLLQEHTVIHAQIIYQYPLIVQINFTLVNAPLVITTPLLDAIYHHIVLLLNHVLIAIDVDLTPIHSPTQALTTNLLLT